MQVRNYQKELEKTIERITKEGRVPSLLLHSCCAPCSSYVLSYLSDYFRITVCYYNPNITLEHDIDVTPLKGDCILCNDVNIQYGQIERITINNDNTIRLTNK